MMPFEASSIIFEQFEICGKSALFTNLRIKRDSLPNGVYAYDCRDECDGVICQIQEHVLVNHWGTIITKEPLELVNGELEVTQDDYNYVGGTSSLEDFLKK